MIVYEIDWAQLTITAHDKPELVDPVTDYMGEGVFYSFEAAREEMVMRLAHQKGRIEVAIERLNNLKKPDPQPRRSPLPSRASRLLNADEEFDAVSQFDDGRQ